jgi:hypothetical protein
MIYKIPIYVEVKVEGDFNPSKLTEAVNTLVYRRVTETVDRSGGFPCSDSDIFDSLGRDVAKAAEVKKITISLLPKSQLFQKIVRH